MTLLPFPDIPPLVCYHNKAFPFGIIQANAVEDITEWMCTKCINLFFNPASPNNKFDFAIWDVWGTSEGITTHQYLNVKREILERIIPDLVPLLRTFLDQGCYVNGFYNEKYIPSKWAYGIKDFAHDYLLVGYDDSFFYSVGFVADGRFKHFKIPIRNFIDSLDGSRFNFNFFSYNRGVTPKPNIDRLIKDLDYYISTGNYMDNSKPDVISSGISALMRVRDFFVDEVEKNGVSHVDKRYSRVIYEHERIFTQMIDAFLDEKEKKEFIICADQNLNRAELVHMLGLKMGFTGETSLIHRISG